MTVAETANVSAVISEPVQASKSMQDIADVAKEAESNKSALMGDVIQNQS